MSDFAVFFDRAFYGHDTGNHPECPERLGAVLDALSESPLRDRLDSGPLGEASREEIQLVHSADYVEFIREACGDGPTFLNPDTPVSPGSWDAALKAAGALARAVRKVVAGELKHVFCLVRPPGHHALGDRAMGFCLFNNIAIGARIAVEELGLERVAIVDWDVHHGNGTQEAFYEDPRVLFVSLHRYPFYPGTGSEYECGSGAGEGFTVNIPLGAGTTAGQYLGCFENRVVPVLERFSPQLVLISAGFDAYVHDTIGGLGLRVDDFRVLTEMVVAATRSGSRGIVATLEGGYNLNALGECVLAHLQALCELA